jgi:hypothetical protein
VTVWTFIECRACLRHMYTRKHTHVVCLRHAHCFVLVSTLHCILSFVAGGANFWGACHLPWNMQLRRSVRSLEYCNSHCEVLFPFLVNVFVPVGRRMYKVGWISRYSSRSFPYILCFNQPTALIIIPQTHFTLRTNIGAETCSSWYLTCGSLVGNSMENKVTFHLRVQYSMAFIAPICAQLILPRRICAKIFHTKFHQIRSGSAARKGRRTLGPFSSARWHRLGLAHAQVMYHAFCVTDGRTDGRGFHIKPSSFILWGRPDTFVRRTSSPPIQHLIGSSSWNGVVKGMQQSMSHTLELGVAVGEAMLVGSAAVPLLWIYVRVISILSALSISQVSMCSVCHAAALSITTHCVDVVAGSREPCVRKGVVCSRRQLKCRQS